eukprot:gene5493-9310_t
MKSFIFRFEKTFIVVLDQILSAFTPASKISKRLVEGFEHEDYYVTFENDAKYIAEEIERYDGGLETISTGLTCLKFTSNKLVSLLSHIFNFMNKKVNYYEWINGKYEKTRTGTPGNHSDFDDIIGDDFDGVNSSSTVASIYYKLVNKQHTIGICIINSDKRIIYINEYTDDQLFSVTQRTIAQSSAKEILFAFKSSKVDDHVDKKMKDIAIECDLLITDKKKKDYEHAEEDLVINMHTLTGEKNVQLIYEKKFGAAAVYCAIHHLGLLADEDNYGYFELQLLKLNEYMKLDQATLTALNIPKLPNQPKSHSLCGLLDSCKSKIASRRLETWIRQPLMDVDRINERLDIVESFTEDQMFTESIRELLRNVPDLDIIFNRVHKLKGKITDFVQIHDFCATLPDFEEAVLQYGGKNEDVLLNKFQFAEHGENLAALVGVIRQVVDFEKVADKIYMIQTRFDEKLQSLDAEMKELYRNIEHLQDDMVKNMDCDVVREDEGGKIKFFIAEKDLKKLEKIGAERVGSKKAKKQEFTHPALQKYVENFTDLREAYEAQQSAIVEKFNKVVCTYLTPLTEVSEAIVEMDILSSFAVASMAATIPYTRPEIREASCDYIMLKESRHPCLELQEGISFIPNDIEMDRKKKTFYIITGPNMGGKSTYIRQIGVNILLAQIGCFVPCEKAIVSVRDGILSRIGANDSQMRGMSTFYLEMHETASILQNATEHSFVIVDELGRGTSTYDGFGLAIEIADELATNKKCFGLFATHFHEIAKLEEDDNSIGNKHVCVQETEDRLTMLYKVEEGDEKRSFGINVAKICKFPESVVKLAKKRALELEYSDDEEEEEDEMPQKKFKTKEEIAKEKIAQEKLIQFCRIPFEQMSEEECAKKLSEFL